MRKAYLKQCFTSYPRLYIRRLLDFTCFIVSSTIYQHNAKEQLTQFVELTHQRFDKKVSGQS